jgi:pyruvate dehydrogenase E2 component (dihydrolipoamide acetyltransferase)
MSAIKASPRARRAMRQQRIDPAALRGSGPGGRIVEADVLAFAGRPRTETAPVSAMRQAIAQRTSESAATIPHFYLRAEADVSALVHLRKQIVPVIEQRSGVRVTFTDLILRALGLALKQCPEANAVWQNNTLLRYDAASVGLVIALDEGMIIPTIVDAAQQSVEAIAGQRAAFQNDAELRKKASALPAAVSLSNLGNGRVDEFDAIIPTGQSMILALGRIAPRPLVVDGKIEIRETLKLSLALDHRVHDGAPASKFLNCIIELLEHPARLLI